MRIISYNVNGIRSALSKGLDQWIAETAFDVYMFQEIKADRSAIPTETFEQLGYRHAWFPAEKKGYSGVGALFRQQPDLVEEGMGLLDYDREGRVLRMDFGNLTLVNAYFPSGSSGDERQAVKMRYLDDFYEYIQELRSRRPNLIVSGDYNICHHAIDIHDPVSNKHSSGFLPEERAWMSKYFANGFIDTFRHFNKDPHHYSWWSFRAGARSRNKGWRIDYHAATEALEPHLRSATIFPDVVHSDHCPIFVELDDVALKG
jgi:exodeoxyribonuclease III